MVLGSKKEENTEKYKITEELIQIKKIYEESDSISILIILLTVDHEKCTEQDLMRVFGVSKYKIDQARKFRKENSGFKLSTTTQKSRVCMDISSTEHFFDFLFSSGACQDFACGTTKIKFEYVAFYKRYCDSIRYQPLSNSSLWHILNDMGPSQRKCLAGIDITGVAEWL